MKFQVKRVYDPPAASDGTRILVDRLWPRGLSRDRAEVDEWIREVSPSTELRKWFGHDPSRWDEFRRRYFEELAENPAVGRLREVIGSGPASLLYAAKDEAHNNAVALKEFLERGGGITPPK